MAEQTSVNLPQIIAVAVIGFLAIRWFMSKSTYSDPSSSSAGQRSSNRSRGQNIDVAKVDQVSAMFPQLDRRQICWDLHRNGGSVEATCNRILTGAGLETPPPTYQPALPPPAAAAGAATGSSRGGSNKSAPGQPDLITRYGLQSRIGGKGKEAVLSEEKEREQRAQKAAWSSDKVARAEGLKRRREEMVLAARKAMEAKTAGSSSAV